MLLFQLLNGLVTNVPVWFVGRGLVAINVEHIAHTEPPVTDKRISV